MCVCVCFRVFRCAEARSWMFVQVMHCYPRAKGIINTSKCPARHTVVLDVLLTQQHKIFYSLLSFSTTWWRLHQFPFLLPFPWTISALSYPPPILQLFLLESWSPYSSSFVYLSCFWVSLPFYHDHELLLYETLPFLSKLLPPFLTWLLFLTDSTHLYCMWWCFTSLANDDAIPLFKLIYHSWICTFVVVTDRQAYYYLEHRPDLNTDQTWTQTGPEHRPDLNTDQTWTQTGPEHRPDLNTDQTWTQTGPEHRPDLNTDWTWTQTRLEHRPDLNTDQTWTQTGPEHRPDLNTDRTWTQTGPEHRPDLNTDRTWIQTGPEYKLDLNTDWTWIQTGPEYRLDLNTD